MLAIKVKLINYAAYLLSLMPLAMNQAVGAWIARLAWRVNSRARVVTQFNLQHCFPDMEPNRQQSLAYDSLLHTGRQLAECAWIWNRPVAHTRQLIREYRGEQLFLDAVASSRGILMVSPHMGNWELCALALSSRTKSTFFYRNPRSQVIAPLLVNGRAHLGGELAPLTPGGIREGLRILKKGGLVGILPDQEPDMEGGVFAPFFNQPALTMTLLSRLAQRSNAHIIFTVAERLPNGQGWRIHYLPGSSDITSSDPVLAATAVNADVERCVAINPAQYLWDYKRFNTRTDGTRRQYPT